MKSFNEPLVNSSEFKSIVKNIEDKNFPIRISECSDASRSHIISNISKDYKYKIIVTYNDIKAKEIYEQYRFFDKSVFIYPAKDILFYSADIRGNLIIKQRLEVIKQLIEHKKSTIIMTVDALMDRLPLLEEYSKNIIDLKVGKIYAINELKENLIRLGYERNSWIDGAGQFSVRGGIIDVYPLSEECPYRIEFFGDEIDSIRSFDVESQRSIEKVEKLKIYSASEFLLSKENIEKGLDKIEKELKDVISKFEKTNKQDEKNRILDTITQLKEELTEFNGAIGIDSYITSFYDKTVSFLDYLNNNETIIFLDEPYNISERGKAYELEFRESMISRLSGGYILPSQSDILYSYSKIEGMIANKNLILLENFNYPIDIYNVKSNFKLVSKAVHSYKNSFENLVNDLKVWKDNNFKVILLSPSSIRARRLVDDLRNSNIEAFFSDELKRTVQSGEIMVATGKLKNGFSYPDLKFVVIAENDIFSVRVKREKKKAQYSGIKINSFADINIGDYIVHEEHGIGIYKGIEKIDVDGVIKDYINIEYADNSNLCILASQLDRIQKYSSANGHKPKINKLGGTEWKKIRNRVKNEVNSVAGELINLYAIRQEKTGFACEPDTIWQKEFEEMFPYEETEDQLKAINEAKADMESEKIMDRLICGDVGYGKTEVAIRTAFKAVTNGKQVVYLVPTTILAQQHYNSFVERMKDFPIHISMLSRFRTPKQQKETIEGLKSGAVDIVVGTHRVLSKDIKYKNLGLLIIDEEQRFGVRHKEKIKDMKKDIDVLTLSATPIPRTLHMSLIGIRDMSVLEEPPIDRRAIQTYVLSYNEELIKEAINRECTRNGQVYYVYNRVNDIDEIANKVQALVPNVKVAFAHGQMSERQLEKIMLSFINKEIDVLVATTIIETGLDIPNVNTMIIHDAENFGLSQLYQLRGRVGRSNRTAYAFLMYKQGKVLKETAEKRLYAIREFTDLGSGFKIAMRDLELRGAGNLLGSKQSGHLEDVGYDLYCKMLNDAIMRLRGEIDENDDFETVVRLSIDAYISAEYVKNEFQKLELYKRIANIENREEFEDIMDEIIDRFGNMPQATINLLRIALLKSDAHRCYITNISQSDNLIIAVMKKDAKVKVEKINEILLKNNNIKFKEKENPVFTLDMKKYMEKDLIDNVEKFINILSELIEK